MPTTNSENIISKINSSTFFKEFTYSKNDFKALDSNQELEFADNVIWLDDLFFIFQIKEREKGAVDDNKWFQNKVLKKAVQQIKSTLKYINTYPEINIENERGHKLDIVKAKNSANVKKIIIYAVDKTFSEDLRYKKFYESSEAGLIHLFHYEDYYWICEYLVTPSEVNEYLDFREKLFLFDKNYSDSLPEQYFLGHFLETPDADHFDESYVNNLTSYKAKLEDFDISGIIDNFSKNIKLLKNETDYYAIIQEFAKLNRSELAEFKKRLLLSIEKSESQENVIPYRMYLPRTDCGFVFIPLHSNNAEHWREELLGYTMMHKYENKAKRCIGVVVFRDKSNMEYFEMFWQFIDSEWSYDAEIEKLLRENYPFRKTQMKRFDNRYKQ